jgi:hypothetical protein
MAELRIVIPDRLEAKLQSAMPDYLDRKGFVCLLLDQALTEVGNLPAYRVGAGTPEDQNAVTAVLPLRSSAASSEAQSTDQAAPPSLGDSPEPKKTKEKRFCFSVPLDLSDYKADLLDYWRNHKSGKKSAAAAKILINGCRKIKELYGDAALKEQLELAKGYGWENITLKNYERYGLNPKAAAKEPEPRHPAYRVFTADNGFGDNDPTTNPILEQLF